MTTLGYRIERRGRAHYVVLRPDGQPVLFPGRNGCWGIRASSLGEARRVIHFDVKS